MKYKVPDIDNAMPGQFGLRKTKYNSKTFDSDYYFIWYACRESFQNDWYGTLDTNFEKIFFYVCDKVNTASFIKKAEDTLGLWIRTKFYHTTDPNICVVTPAPFWRNNSLRMSLFTILLRASLDYGAGQNWLECLFENNYAQSTRRAIMYFLDGHTVPLKKSDNFVDGWRNQFAYYDGPLDEVLRRPRLNALFLCFKNLFISIKRRLVG
jgi:hypothetical protein